MIISHTGWQIWMKGLSSTSGFFVVCAGQTNPLQGEIDSADEALSDTEVLMESLDVDTLLTDLENAVQNNLLDDSLIQELETEYATLSATTASAQEASRNLLRLAGSC